MNIVEAGKAIESYGWAMVKWGQKIIANNEKMAEKWVGVANERAVEVLKAITLWRNRKEFARRFKAGPVPEWVKGNVDVFISKIRDNGDTRVSYNVPAFIACNMGNFVDSWRLSS